MSRFRLVEWLLLGVVSALAACGGDSGTPATSSGSTPIHTLAYVVDECRQNSSGFFERGALVIQDGDHAPVTVAEIAEVGPIQLVSGLCTLLGRVRLGSNSVGRGGFTGLGVSPDGSTVVFEETDEFSSLSNNFLAPEQRGIFVVRADGTGLHWLAPPSHEPPHYNSLNAFSPDGRKIAFVDKGPSSTGEEASQIATLDLETGERTQLTHLPPIPATGSFPGVFAPVFLDNEAIAFASLLPPTCLTGGSCMNQEGKVSAFSVKTDGSSLEAFSTAALPGSQLVPIFAITGNRPIAVPGFVPGVPSGPMYTNPPLTEVSELFVVDGPNVLQLTNFGRADTVSNGALVASDQAQVFFVASADPLRTNPLENCQLFSIDRDGADLRQLTNFGGNGHSQVGCDFNEDAHGCPMELTAQDVTTQTLVFGSTCDPFGSNPSGEQIFAMRPDGKGLRQLTNLRGLFKEPDGTVHAELPGPLAYGPYGPGGTNH
jgi:WD40 repeat protein